MQTCLLLSKHGHLTKDMKKNLRKKAIYFTNL